MLFQMSNALLAFLAMVSARDTGKLIKAVPTISNSLVNLGKMDISFYFNGKHADMPSRPDHVVRSEYLPQAPIMEQSCPCSDFKAVSTPFLADPSEIMTKILKSNDFFKDPSSSFCCSSHEHVQESTVFFEVIPKNTPRNVNTVKFPANSNIQRSPLPFIFSKTGAKPKALEIILFPKRKDMSGMDLANIFGTKKRNVTHKPQIQIVGDKTIPTKQPSASVKKDLAYMEKKKLQESVVIPVEELHTDAPPVTNVNNAL